MNRGELLRYLQGLPERADQRVIVGQRLGYNMAGVIPDFWTTFTEMERTTGRWPALVGTSILGFDATVADARKMVWLLSDFSKRGGLVQLDMFPANPWTGGDHKDKASRNLSELSDPNSAVYGAWMRMLDEVAGCLAQLRDQGVVVLWRPFHEMNYQDCFWWDGGAYGGDKAPYVNAWRHMHDYFVKQRGLDNLVWVYATANIGYFAPDYFYPGDEYVDVVGIDVYSDSGTIRSGMYERMVALGKPFALTEAGPYPTYDGSWNCMAHLNAIKSRYPRTVYVYFWSNWVAHWLTVWSVQGGRALMSDPWSVGLAPTGEPCPADGMWFCRRGKHPNALEIGEDVRAKLAVIGAAQLRGGRYLQGLRAGTVPSGTQVAAIDVTRRPSDQAEDWRGLGLASGATVRGRYYVDVYDGPSGPGYIVGCEIENNGRWRYEQQVGPEERGGPFGEWIEVVIRE